MKFDARGQLRGAVLVPDGHRLLLGQRVPDRYVRRVCAHSEVRAEAAMLLSVTAIFLNLRTC